MEPLSRVFYLGGEVSEVSIGVTISGIVECLNQNKRDPITLIISTYGGSVDEMFGLYDIMKYAPCPVHTVAIGKVMSAGVLLLAAGTKGCRIAGNSARIMIHPLSAVTEGNVFQMESELKEYKRMDDLANSLLLKETRMTAKQLEAYMRSGVDVYITPDEAKRLGIVDKIIGTSA